MAKSNEEFMKQQLTGSIGGGDEDYLYEQYLAQEKLNEEYWQWKSVQEHSIFPDELQYDDEYYNLVIYQHRMRKQKTINK